ncbi:MAG: amidase [Pseudomonadota bacterium]
MLHRFSTSFFALAITVALSLPQAAKAGDKDSAPLQKKDIIEAVDGTNLTMLTIPELLEQLGNGTLTSEALVQAYLERIEALDRNGPKLQSIIAVMTDPITQARARDAERIAGNVRGPLHGIPIIIKDNIEASGPMPTTAGSYALINNVTNRDAPLVARLKAAGAIILAKANLSQWANIRSNNSTSGWSSIGGLVRNPYALDRNSCGSSSGSGAAAAAGLGAGAIGTETDGSITCPASTNGVVGFKPTVGMVSRTHVVPISHSQDTAGPMTRSVTGAAHILTAIAGSDPADRATAQADQYRTDFAAGLSDGYLKGVRIGVMRDRIGDQAKTSAIFDEALKDLEKAGAVLVDIADSRSMFEGLGEAEFEVLMTELKADMNSYLASLPGTVESRTLADLIAYNKAHAATEMPFFGQELFELAQSKGDLDSEAYVKALEKARTTAGPGIDKLLADHDVQFLIGPTRGPAWLSDLVNSDSFSGPSQSQIAAVAGYPHLTVPMGFVEGLPVGISFIGTQWSDHAVLKAGYAYEQASKKFRAPMFPPTLPLNKGPLPLERQPQ